MKTDWRLSMENLFRKTPILGSAVFLNPATEMFAYANTKEFFQLLFANAQTSFTAGTTVQLPQIVHIIVTGQSNSIGSQATPLYDTATQAGGIKFNGGMKPGSGGSQLDSFMALQEEDSGTTPNTMPGDSGMVSMVRWLHNNSPEAPANTLFLVSNVGVDGARYDALKKGTSPYSQSIAQVTAAKAICLGMGIDYKVLCVVNVHGETDDAFQDPNYRAYLVEWQSDYETDCKAVTGQAGIIPMFMPQVGAAPIYGANETTPTRSTAVSMMDMNLAHPTKIILVGTQAPFDYYKQPHFTAFCHAWQGEYLAKAIKRVCFDGLGYVPLHLSNASIVGNTIVMNFAGGVSPLRFDYKFSVYAPHRGFRFDSSAGTLYPTSAALTGAMQITITFASAPGGTNKLLSYDSDNLAPKRGRSSNVEDSDPTEGFIGVPLRNRLAIFLYAL